MEREIQGFPYWLVAQNVFLLREMFEDPCVARGTALEATGAWFAEGPPLPHEMIQVA